MKASATWAKQQLVNTGLKLNKKFFLSSKDFAVAGANVAAYERQGRSPACYDYAFYHLHQETLFPFIFHQEEASWPQELILDTVSYLEKMGYTKVDKPQAGDLVAYHSTLVFPARVAHWGIWTSEGKVASKWGKTDVFTHDLSSILIAYGNGAYFFRKNIRSQAILQLLQEIAQANETLEHPSLSSPLTAKGCYEVWAGLIEKALLQKIKNSFKHSLYGKEYHRFLYRRLQKKLNVIDMADLPKLKVLKIVEDRLQKANQWFPRPLFAIL